MAAVVASLAAFLTAGIPANLATRDREPAEVQQGAGRAEDADWSSSTNDEPFEVGLSAFEALAIRPELNLVRKAHLQTSASVCPSVVKHAIGCSLSGGAERKAVITAASPPRRVRFHLERITEHEVTPYSEVYGVHPREFNFGREVVGPASFIGDENCESDDSSEEDDVLNLCRFRRKYRKLREVKRRPKGRSGLPRHGVVVLCILGFLVQAFFTQEIFSKTKGNHSFSFESVRSFVLDAYLSDPTARITL